MKTITRLPDALAAAQWLRSRGCTHLHSDSRRVQVNDGFLAWPGAHFDGRSDVTAVIDRGAAAALVQEEGLPPEWVSSWSSDLVASLPELRQHAGAVADAFYGHPSQAIKLVAITGTNGKTSSAWWLAQALEAHGWPCGMIGTLGMGRLDQRHGQGLTTPPAVELHDALARMRDQGLRACALEASSIGIVEQRLQATHIQVAVFTNLSQDHLDYHSDMASYWAAKRQLFAWPGLQAAVVNIDDPHGWALSQQLPPTVALWSVGTRSEARLRAHDIRPSSQGTQWLVTEQGDAQTHVLHTPMVGHYNVLNVMGVIGSLRALGLSLSEAVHACQMLSAVPGRLQRVGQDNARALVLVDYAHTPDAVSQVLAALRPVAAQRGGQLWCVLGCGGDRDASKRAPMAASAEAGADQVVLTSDNPRSEDPQRILDAMLQGLTRAPHAVITDRALGIAHAIHAAAPQDVVLIAGKGHEDYQEIAGQRLPFSDHDVALASLHSLTGATP